MERNLHLLQSDYSGWHGQLHQLAMKMIHGFFSDNQDSTVPTHAGLQLSNQSPGKIKYIRLSVEIGSDAVVAHNLSLKPMKLLRQIYGH